MYKRILVPVDGSETSEKALAVALQLARDSDGCVRIVHALDEFDYLTGYVSINADALSVARESGRIAIRDAMAKAQAACVPADSKLLEVPGRHLGEVVAEGAHDFGADLVVVGTHSRRGVSRVMLGSGAEQVIRMSPVPVLCVRASDNS